MEKNNHEILRKVPQITLIFWIAKLLTDVPRSVQQFV
jgi:uncharacterized membrane-anchored protein